MSDKASPIPKFYILFLESDYEFTSISPSNIDVIGIFSSIPLLAKAARNFPFKENKNVYEKLFVSQILMDEAYTIPVSPIRISYDKFKKIPEVADIIRRG